MWLLKNVRPARPFTLQPDHFSKALTMEADAREAWVLLLPADHPPRPRPSAPGYSRTISISDFSGIASSAANEAAW